MWEAGTTVVVWIGLSITVVLYNKYLLDTLMFHLPCTLVVLHQAVTALLACLAAAMDDDLPSICMRDVFCTYLPLAVLFAINLYLSNIVYMHLSVALIQMIKAVTPCFVFGVAFCMNIESVTFRLAAAIVIISAGVLLSTCGADKWQTFGVTIQLGAILADAVRLNLAEHFLSKDATPLGMLCLTAPLTLLCLCGVWVCLEAERAQEPRLWARVHPLHFVLNPAAAFLLNVTGMMLVKKTSALALNASGVVRDLLLIGWSVYISHAVVQPLQFLGYVVSTVGMSLYIASRGKQRGYMLLEAEETR